MLTYAKNFYNCSSLSGFPLENGGSSGSAGAHWEKTIVLYEVMGPSVAFGMYMSKLTGALFEDSGWYLVNDDL